jgi:hypothetical protein
MRGLIALLVLLAVVLVVLLILAARRARRERRRQELLPGRWTVDTVDETTEQRPRTTVIMRLVNPKTHLELGLTKVWGHVDLDPEDSGYTGQLAELFSDANAKASVWNARRARRQTTEEELR